MVGRFISCRVIRSLLGIGEVMVRLTLLLFCLFGWLQYSFWLGDNGIGNYMQVSNKILMQQASNAKLKARNNRLFAKIGDLNNHIEVIEEKARIKLGMIKCGETFYRLVSN